MIKNYIIGFKKKKNDVKKQENRKCTVLKNEKNYRISHHKNVKKITIKKNYIRNDTENYVKTIKKNNKSVYFTN